MSDNFNKSLRSGTSDIQWNLLDDGLGKTGKSSGIKIEYSMSDEINFTQKLSIILRKQLMRQLLRDEDEMYQQELKRIGLLYSRDTVCEEIRNCNREQQYKKQKHVNNAQKSNLSKLFKMYDL